MHPIAFILGPVTVRWYGIGIALSIIISVTAAYLQSKNEGIDTDAVLDTAIVAIIGGVVGARIGWIVTSPNLIWYLSHPLRIFAIWEGGFSYFSAIIGGVVFANWMIKRRHLRFWHMADIAAPFLALSFGIGKIGCWLNGCCHGKVTTSCLGVVFTNPLSECELLGQRVWPAQLFNSVCGFATFAVLYWIIRRRKAYDGQVFAWYLLLYAATGFVVEFYRYIPVHFVGLTPNQWTDLIVAGVGLVLQHRLPTCAAVKNGDHGETGVGCDRGVASNHDS